MATLGGGTKRPSTSTALTMQFKLNRRQEVCRTKQSWSRCGPAHCIVSAVRWSAKLSQLCEISFLETSSPTDWHRVSLISLSQHEIPGEIPTPSVHYFNNLTAKGRDTNISLDYLHLYQDSHRTF